MDSAGHFAEDSSTFDDMPSRLILLAAACLLSSADALLVGGGVVPRAHAASNVRMLWGSPTKNTAIDRDFERRQEMLNARRAKSAATPKGQVEVTIAGRKTTAKQGEPIAAVARRAGVKIKFDCKVRAHVPSRLACKPVPLTRARRRRTAGARRAKSASTAALRPRSARAPRCPAAPRAS